MRPGPVMAKVLALRRSRPHEVELSLEGVMARGPGEALAQLAVMVGPAAQSFDDGAPLVCKTTVGRSIDGTYIVKATLTSHSDKPSDKEDLALKIDAALTQAAKSARVETRRLGKDFELGKAPERPPKKKRPGHSP